jgi:hypothetical protein
MNALFRFTLFLACITAINLAFGIATPANADVQGPCPGELSLCKLPTSRRSSGSSLDHSKTFAIQIRERNAASISDGHGSAQDVLQSMWNVSDL